MLSPVFKHLFTVVPEDGVITGASIKACLSSLFWVAGCLDFFVWPSNQTHLDDQSKIAVGTKDRRSLDHLRGRATP